MSLPEAQTNKDIKTLTKRYIEEFNNKNLPALLSLMDENFKLTDPGNRIEGITECEQFLKNLFVNDISFDAHDIFIDGDHSIIHFKIKINDKTLHGADIIKWKRGKMISLIAYL